MSQWCRPGRIAVKIARRTLAPRSGIGVEEMNLGRHLQIGSTAWSVPQVGLKNQSGQQYGAGK